jgi:hypothetical protein
MVGVREHIYRLNGLHFIFRIEQLQVARLRSRITADVYDAKYKVKAVQPVDMFPHTHHVENVVLLELKD